MSEWRITAGASQKFLLLQVMECGEIDLAHVLQRQSNNMNVVRVYWQQVYPICSIVRAQC